MNLRQLEVFQAVMQTGNMSAAARLICITPSAVSKTVSHTELQLGYKLFTRAKGVLAPTPEALVLYAESVNIHQQLEQLRLISVNLREVDQGQVRLAAIPSISHEFLPGVLAQHVTRYPHVNLEVRTLHQEQMVSVLLNRSVDFALGFYPHPHPQLANRLLISGRLHLAVTREIWLRAVRVRRANPISFMSNTPLIRLVGEDPMRAAIEELVQRLGANLESGVQVQTSRLALELVRLGMGWTVIDFLTASNLDPHTMVAVELHDLPVLPLYAYHAINSPPGRQAERMLTMLPGLLTHAIQRTQTSPPV